MILSLGAFGFLAATTGAPVTTPAAAEYYASGYYRVVDVPGEAQIDLLARPNPYARVRASLPFNAERLRATGRERGGWVELAHRGVTGWIDARFIAEHEVDKPTTYRVAGLEQYGSLNIRASGSAQSRIVGQIPYDARDVLNCGPCVASWCPIRHEGTDGWVHRRYLVADRGDDETLYDSTPYLGSGLEEPRYNDRRTYDQRFGARRGDGRSYDDVDLDADSEFDDDLAYDEENSSEDYYDRRYTQPSYERSVTPRYARRLSRDRSRWRYGY
ncbi:MAG: hypothetical protein GC150_02905 [Rhizobiales bacterium]|nr:hypothetical protein [Hyphomicrobiales bacterium]